MIAGAEAGEEVHGLPPERVVVTGAPQLVAWNAGSSQVPSARCPPNACGMLM